MSRFVAAGTQDATSANDDEWLAAEQRIKDSKQQKSDTTQQQDGKSLFEVLQANKAAKQEAHEESIKLKNQFRNLDDDEVDFLDSVLESTRAKDATIKKDTREQLEAFRTQQEEAARMTRETEDEDVPAGDEEQWIVGKKRRRREKGDTVKGLKLRRKSSTASQNKSVDGRPTVATPVDIDSPQTFTETKIPSQVPEPNPGFTITTAAIAQSSKAGNTVERPSNPGPNLVAYNSDDD